jgi:hypothetical protein
MAVWVAAAVLFGGVLVAARAAEGPLDDPDPALQRPGFVDAGPLPSPAPTVTDDVPAEGRPSVVFFSRPDRLGPLCHALSSQDLGDDIAVVIVVAGADQGCPGGTPVIEDPGVAIARRYGLRQPRGGGPPVGYAVVDADRRIRYRTLDPTVHAELAEVATILEALR